MAPSFLITHAWLRGNLGDFCITRRIAAYLRQTFPDAVIDVAGMTLDDWIPMFELRCLVSRVMERHYKDDLSDLFPQYSAVINAPGGGMQMEGDERMPFILQDAATCNAAGIPHIMASHSFDRSAVTDALKGSLIIAREPESVYVLRTAGLQPVEAADLAFLEPMPEMQEKEKAARERTLVMLRFDHFKKIELHHRTLHLDDRTVELPDAPIMLGTSDPFRDGSLLSELSESWRMPCLPSHTMTHLLHAIGTSKLVITDRYHPAIFSRMLGVPCIFVQRNENNRDAGLQKFLDEKTTDELATMAQHGLDAIGDFLKTRL